MYEPSNQDIEAFIRLLGGQQLIRRHGGLRDRDRLLATVDGAMLDEDVDRQRASVS